MKNREWLLKTAAVDVLGKMNNSLRTFHSPASPCIIVALGLHARLGRCGNFNSDCSRCIAAWLNEEHEESIWKNHGFQNEERR